MMVDANTILTVVITLITVLGSNAAWKYYEKRLNFKLQQKKLDEEGDHMHVNDLKKRIDNLEKLLREAKTEKDDLRTQVIKLTAETSAMRIELEYIKKENDLLKKLIDTTSVQKPKKLGSRPRKTV